MKYLLIIWAIFFPLQVFSQGKEDVNNWKYTGDKNIVDYSIRYGVMKIGNYAFDSCVNLQTLRIPASVKIIGDYVFHNCPSLKTIIVDNNNKHFCTMDGVLFTNDQKTLVYCPNMRATDDYKIPQCVTTIGESAFLSCKNLTKVIIPPNVEVIGSSAFEECYNIETVFISKNVKEINGCAFSTCYKLKNFEVDHENKYFSTIDGVLFNYDKTKLVSCPQRTTYTIPSSTKAIGYFSFQGCQDLVSVTIPNCVEKIESGAFSICNGLTEITIPESVTEIGHSTFWMSKNLKTVKLPNGIKIIREGTFKQCESLEKINIPDSVEEIEKYAFQECYRLKTINIPHNVREIGKYAFYKCNSIETLIIPENVKGIGVGVFQECERLATVKLENGIEQIGEAAFLLCTNLHTINFPKSIKNTGGYVCQKCYSLENITIENDFIEEYVFSKCNNLKSITIPENVKTIKQNAFWDCEKLQSVKMDNGIERICKHAFQKCNSLTSITIPSSVKEIGEDVFPNLTSINTDGASALSKLIIYKCMSDVYKQKEQYDSMQNYIIKMIDILHNDESKDVYCMPFYMDITNYYNLIGDYEKVLNYSKECAFSEFWYSTLDEEHRYTTAPNGTLLYTILSDAAVKYTNLRFYCLLQMADTYLSLKNYEETELIFDLFRMNYPDCKGGQTDGVLSSIDGNADIGTLFYFLLLKMYYELNDIDNMIKYTDKSFFAQVLKKTKSLYLIKVVVYYLKIREFILGNLTESMLEAFKHDLQRVIQKTGVQYNRYYEFYPTFGDCHYHQDNFDSAFAYYSKSFDYELAKLKDNFSFMNTYQRQNYWEEHRNSFENIVKISTQLPNNDTAIGMAYNSLLVSKGLILASEQNLTSIILDSKDDSLKNNFFALKTYRTQLDTIKNEKSRDSIRALAEHLETDLMQRSSQFADIVGYMNVDWQMVKKNLGKKDVAIEFFYDRDSLYALVLKKDFNAPRLVALKKFRYKSPFNERGKMIDGNSYSTTDIYEAVWKPLEQYLSPKGNVYFSPSGALYNIAIEYAPIDATHLISEKYKIYRISSTRLLALNKGKSKLSKTAAVFGGIEYNFGKGDWLDLKDNSDSIQVAFRDVPIIEEGTLRSGVTYLSGSKLEYEAVSQIIKDAHYQLVDNTTGITATEELFKKLSGQGISNMLISTHGFYQPMDTVVSNNYEKEDISLSQSGLLLAGANSALDPKKRKDIPEGVDDGILTAKEISRLDFKGLDLVVLSACQTGLGEVTSEGVFGLQRGFKKAGAQTIVMSLWKVDDNATKDLMTEFYKNLVNGKSKREAFLKAQDNLRTKYPDPQKWAAFVMVDGI